MMVMGLLVVTAHPAAAPMSGAVHGVESTAVITPKIALPPIDSCLVSIAYTHCGRPTVKKPAIATAITAMKRPTPIVNAGYWKSWFDCSKPFTKLSNSPSPSQNATTPAVIETPSMKVRERLPAAAFASPMILSGITGSTHGVRLRMAPPTNASTSITGKNVPESGSRVKSQPKSGTTNGFEATRGAASPMVAFSFILPKTVGSKPTKSGVSAAPAVCLAPGVTSTDTFASIEPGARQTVLHACSSTVTVNSTVPVALGERITGMKATALPS